MPSAEDSACGGKRVASRTPWRTGHRLDGKTATVDVGKRVTAEEHQVRVALVDPKRDLRSVVRISELHTSEAIMIPLKVGERMVERSRADPPRLPKIVFRVLHGVRVDRKAALGGPQQGLPGYAQNQTIDSCGPEGQVWMSATTVGAGVRAEVRGSCLHPESVV